MNLMIEAMITTTPYHAKIRIFIAFGEQVEALIRSFNIFFGNIPTLQNALLALLLPGLILG